MVSRKISSNKHPNALFGLSGIYALYALSYGVLFSNLLLYIIHDKAINSSEGYFEQDACDIVNIKLAKCGGINQEIQIKNLADQYDKKCMVGCMMESPLGVFAAASFALAYDITLVDLDPIDWVSQVEYEDLISYRPPFIMI